MERDLNGAVSSTGIFIIVTVPGQRFTVETETLIHVGFVLIASGVGDIYEQLN